MTIFYCAVAKNKKIVKEFATTKGNFRDVVQQLLAVDQSSSEKMTYQSGEYSVHRLCAPPLDCVVVTDPLCPQHAAFALIDDLRVRPEDAPALVSRYNENSDSKMSAVKANIEEVKRVMAVNIDKIVERGERLDDLSARTEDMRGTSFLFKKNAVALKRKMWWKNIKCYIIMGVVLLVCLYFCCVLVCGGFTLPDCRSSGSGDTK